MPGFNYSISLNENKQMSSEFGMYSKSVNWNMQISAGNVKII
jgi:hypothetical protein